MSKSSTILKAVYKDCLSRGYVVDGNDVYPPDHPKAIAIMATRSARKPRTVHIKTGWIDDTRNIKNKQANKDMFMMMIEKELDVIVWPEFFFSAERLYRADYAIPVLKDGTVVKCCIEVNGGVWSKGNSGHSSGKGILRDYEKANLLQSLGWKLITITPDQMLTSETIELIKSVIKQKS